MKALFFKIVFLLLCTLPTALLGWNESGHQVVSSIAWDNLLPEVREKVIEILKQAEPDTDIPILLDEPLKKEQGKAWFMKVSYWPDIIRDKNQKARYEKYHHGQWHYIERYWEQSPMGGVDMNNFPVNSENSVERVEYFRKTLSDPNIPDSEKAIQIAWVLHLIADIHQPLHNGSLVTEEHPKGDRGGNDFKLTEEWPNNLHAYWDGILDIEYDLKYPDYQYSDLLKIAKKITREHPKKDLAKKVKIDEAMKWSDEGNRIVKISAYPPYLKENEKPSDRYKENVYKHCSYHIALAGYRMAEFLNTIFG